MTRINGFSSIAAAVSMTALQSLRATIGASKIERHDAIEVHCATIAALALCMQPPKGQGNPADHTQVVKAFTDAGLKRYAEAFKGFSVALKHKGMRSIADWDEAMLEGVALVAGIAAEGNLRPKVRTAAELKASELKKAEKKAARTLTDKEAADKAEADAQAAMAQAEQAAFLRGQSEGRPLTAQAVADCIRAGAFTAAELSLIADALKAAPVDADAREVRTLALAA